MFVGLVNDEGDAMLDERARRVVKLPESEETDRADLEPMLSIIVAYRERRFLRGLFCERERKNDLHGIGDEIFLGKTWARAVSPFVLEVWSRLAEVTQNRELAGHVPKKSVESVGKVCAGNTDVSANAPQIA